MSEIFNDRQAMQAIEVLKKYSVEEVLNAMKGKVYRIVGSEIDFKFETDSEFQLKMKALDIWENPDKYSDYKKGSESAYYDFLKFLWVESPDVKEITLSNYIEVYC